MKKIKRDNLDQAYQYIKGNCEDLYKCLFRYYFFNGSSSNVLEELKKYQNEDGGFGHGLEPDFLLPLSSPMSTTIAFQILNDLEVGDSEIIEKAVNYLDKSFDENRPGWWSVPQEVNDYPHAPWWNYDLNEKCTVIDHSWGNPSAEILGILFKYRKYKVLNLEKILDFAVEYLLNIKKFKSEHELYCYIRMYPQISHQGQLKIRKKISEGIKQLICLDPEKWNNYVPRPFDFIQSKIHPLFSEIEDFVDLNCNYLVDKNEDGIWQPNWKWNTYENDWKKSKKNWTAILTIKYYQILAEFRRIERT
ncbi:MAG: hypothetical protein APR63_01865 [Desulfuromonas sp. SDB]|nr:MAG: hypothetical protein APR63_01865 [Desulfuromonas sp. SDB]